MNTQREQQIVKLAKNQYDQDVVAIVSHESLKQLTSPVSEGDDNGAYVLGWVWVDFEGTALDKAGEA